MANADPYCAAPGYLNKMAQKIMAEKYSEQAARLRESFAARYDPTPFSNRFLSGPSLDYIFSKINRQDLGDLNIVEEIISFIVRWDAEQGFDGTESMLERARYTMLKEISLKVDEVGRCSHRGHQQRDERILSGDASCERFLHTERGFDEKRRRGQSEELHRRGHAVSCFQHTII